jgi:hypothetical protein
VIVVIMIRYQILILMVIKKFKGFVENLMNIVFKNII